MVIGRGFVGGRRYERMANGRRLFEEHQLRAAVRRNPEAAIAILPEEGHGS